MSTRSFKSISPQELETAIASAVSALTNTPTKVSVSQWNDVTTGGQQLSRQQHFEFKLSLSATKSDDDPTLIENIVNSFGITDEDQLEGRSRIARASLKDDLDPATREDDDTRPF